MENFSLKYNIEQNLYNEMVAVIKDLLKGQPEEVELVSRFLEDDTDLLRPNQR